MKKKEEKSKGIAMEGVQDLYASVGLFVIPASLVFLCSRSSSSFCAASRLLLSERRLVVSAAAAAPARLDASVLSLLRGWMSLTREDALELFRLREERLYRNLSAYVRSRERERVNGKRCGELDPSFIFLDEKFCRYHAVYTFLNYTITSYMKANI